MCAEGLVVEEEIKVRCNAIVLFRMADRQPSGRVIPSCVTRYAHAFQIRITDPTLFCNLFVVSIS